MLSVWIGDAPHSKGSIFSPEFTGFMLFTFFIFAFLLVLMLLYVYQAKLLEAVTE